MTMLVNKGKTTDFAALVLILSVAVVVAYGYFNRIDRPTFGERFEIHRQIIEGTAPSPYRYRVLVPFIAEGLIKAVPSAFGPKASFLMSYALYDLVSIALLLITLQLLLRRWFDTVQALVGVLFVAGTMPIALQDHYFQPWSLLEPALFSAALLAIHENRPLLLALLTGLASLNRETGIFVPIMLLTTIDVTGLFGDAKRRSAWKRPALVGGLFLVWVGTWWGLHQLRGSAPPQITLEEVLVINLTSDSLLRAAWNGTLLLGGFWVFAVLGFRHAPGLIQRVSLIIPVYAAAVLAGAVWYEVRVLMPLYAVLVPLGLSFLFRDGVEIGDLRGG